MLIAILILSMWPLPEQPDAPANLDKIIHTVVFAFLMLWFTGLSDRSRYWKIFLLLVVYGAVMEVLQSFTPYRFMDLGDLIADIVGLCFGWIMGVTRMGGWCGWLEARLP